jgi:hypothetical protein
VKCEARHVFCADVEGRADEGLTVVQETMSYIAEKSGLTLKMEPGAGWANKELRLVPKRLFKGTFNSEILRKMLSEKEAEWYEEMREKERDFDKKSAEAVNFMDGKRSVSDIVKAVSSEYSETDPAHVLKSLRDLERADLVTLS